MARSKSKITPIELDGRTLEGGGQLLRLALCLSALTRIPVTITDIRGKRRGGGGLKAQHVACVNWLARACGAGDEIAKKGQKMIEFVPDAANVESEENADIPMVFQEITKDGKPILETQLDIETAGSTGLALQAILPSILFSRLPSDLPIHLTLTGGTNVSGSPSYDYIEQVLLPTLHGIGLPLMTVRLEKRGWSQGGGSSIGSFTLEIPPRPSPVLPAFHWSPTNKTSLSEFTLINLHGTLLAPKSMHEPFQSTLPQRIDQSLSSLFPSTLPSQTLTLQIEDSGHEKRVYFLLVATLTYGSGNPKAFKLAADNLHERRNANAVNAARTLAAIVPRSLAVELRSRACVDLHLRDQLVVFQALASGRSVVWPGFERGVSGEGSEEGEGQGEGGGGIREPSLHARTAEWVAKQILKVRFSEEGECEGVGFGVG